MSLLFHEQLFEFYSQVPPSYMIPASASRSVLCIGALCSRVKPASSRIIAALLGLYMLMFYFAASVTSSKVEAAVSSKSTHLKRSEQRRRNPVRAESPAAAVSGAGKRGHDSINRTDRFCRTCLIFKQPRYCLRRQLFGVSISPSQ
jgi:hypothetical protein